MNLVKPLPSPSVISPATNQAPFTPDQAEPSPVGKGRKILVVDDNPVVLKAFEQKFKASGFDVVVAQDSTSAIIAARSHQPSLIILDINFPADDTFSSLHWNGLNILQWFKRFQEVASIPIVVVSGDEPSKYKADVLANGAAAYFQKPVNFVDFITTVLPLLDGNAQPAVQHEI